MTACLKCKQTHWPAGPTGERPTRKPGADGLCLECYCALFEFATTRKLPLMNRNTVSDNQTNPDTLALFLKKG